MNPNTHNNIVTAIDKIEEELVHVKTFVAKHESPDSNLQIEPSRCKRTVVLNKDVIHEYPDTDPRSIIIITGDLRIEIPGVLTDQALSWYLR